jgi:hypothetical protein
MKTETLVKKLFKFSVSPNRGEAHQWCAAGVVLKASVGADLCVRPKDLGKCEEERFNGKTSFWIPAFAGITDNIDFYLSYIFD